MKIPPSAAPVSTPVRRFLWLGVWLAVAMASPAGAQTTFQNVPIGGGGYVTGLVVHPQNTSVMYARTDVGGTYLYNPTSHRWSQLMGQFVGGSYYSCEAMAVDPSDTTLQKVYAFIGNGGAGQAFVERSGNQGGSWVDTGLPTSVSGYGNGDYRWAGSRLAIDPNKPGRALLGTRINGLYLNTDLDTSTVSASTWSAVSGVPVGTGTGSNRQGNAEIGITFVAFYKGSGSSGSPTPVIYVGVSGQGVYHSVNAGSSWSALSGSPAYPVHGTVDSSGNLYVTSGNAIAGSSYGGVWKYSGSAWSNLTPPASSGSEFSGLGINPNNSSDIVVATWATNAIDDVYYSSSGGASGSWSATKTPSSSQNQTVPWQPSSWFALGISDALFVPTTANPNQVWFGGWYDAWNCPDITGSTPSWTDYMAGFEETYILAFRAASPIGSGTAVLFTGCEDVDGFRHTSLSSDPSAANRFSGENDTTGIDVYEGNNNYVYRVGDTGQTSGFGFRSTDNGVTWAGMTLPTNSNGIAMGGKIAVSATNSSLLVWVPVVGSGAATTPYYSTNSGTSWTASSGAPSKNWANNTYYAGQVVASNKLNTNCFYVYLPVSGAGFYTSNTGSSAGSTFSATGSGLPAASSVSGYSMFGVKSVPGQDGGVWVNLAGSGSAYGVYSSTNYGSTFSKVSGVISATAIAFGATNPTSGSPAAVYLLGEMTGDTNDWIYESDDMGKTWTKLNSSGDLFGDKAVNLEADRTTYGRVYVGTFGTGGSYGTTSILFSDNFEDGNANSWTVDSGSWSVVSNGTGNVYKGTGTGFSQAGSSAWTDYSVQADITPTTLAKGEALELCLDFTSASQNYMAQLYPGAIDIVLTKSTGQTVLISKAYTITAGTTYDVELADVGGTLQLYVNGTLELTANDSTYSSGGIAVGSYNATGEFGNIVATQQ